MEELKTSEEFEDAVMPEEAVSDTSVPEEDEDVGEEEKAPVEDWEKRCLAAEAALDDSLEFAVLYAESGGGLIDGDSMRESSLYRRFSELRALGLSTKEAFCAADSAREKKRAAQNAAKDHLCSTHTARRPAAERLQGEELMIAKGLLGEDYSYDELMKLYRRVAK